MIMGKESIRKLDMLELRYLENLLAISLKKEWMERTKLDIQIWFVVYRIMEKHEAIRIIV